MDNKPALGEVSVFGDTHRQLSVLEKEKKNIGQDVSWTWIHVSGINLDSGTLQNCLRWMHNSFSESQPCFRINKLYLFKIKFQCNKAVYTVNKIPVCNRRYTRSLQIEEKGKERNQQGAKRSIKPTIPLWEKI